MNTTGILVIDLEMTCWGKSERKGRQEIIQVGIVNMNPVTLELTKSASYFVKPKFSDKLSEYCENLTGITNKQVFKEGRPLLEVMETLSKKWGFSNKVLVFWGDDHLDFSRDCKNQGIEDKTSTHVINLGLQYSLYHAKKNKIKFRNIGLKEAMSEEGLEFEGKAHNGLVDAINTARLYKKING